MHSNIVNENRSSIDPIEVKNNNVNVDKYGVARAADRIADLLLFKLGMSEESRGFMCKVAYKLPEARIWSNLEKALTAKKSKPGLFIWLCKKDGV
jgi:hypothetical protein